MANNIEHDRRSAVSSFYGGRRSSVDILNSEPPVREASPGMRGVDVGSQRSRRGGPDRDDASSFFSPHMQSQSAGYNRQSFFDAGRTAPVKGGRDEEDAAFIGGNPGQQQDAGWDVYADFNNMGPRYSNAFVKYDEGYQRLPPDTHSVSTPPVKYEEEASTGPVEMVTVPALGAEWRKTELKSMTKAGRRELKSGEGIQWKRWWRDQEGLCGRWGTRKQIAITAFVVAAIIAIVIAFTIPRVPGFAFASSSPLVNATDGITPEFSRTPANFSFNADLDLQIDTGSNFLPLKFSRLSAELFDLQTEILVATGNITGRSFPAKKFTEFLLPLNFTYVALNDSDPTWNNWYNACKNSALYANGSRPGVDFRIQLTMNIAGLIGTHSAATQVSNVNCPFELPQNSV